MKTLENPYIVKLLAVCTHTPRSFIVFEAMDETLYAVLRRQMLTKPADILASKRNALSSRAEGNPQKFDGTKYTRQRQNNM